jgi:hypothetical protein
MPIQWEYLGTSKTPEAPYAPSFAVALYRAKVPGGWLLMTLANGEWSNLTFYPDQHHRWDGSSLS